MHLRELLQQHGWLAKATDGKEHEHHLDHYAAYAYPSHALLQILHRLASISGNVRGRMFATALKIITSGAWV